MWLLLAHQHCPHLHSGCCCLTDRHTSKYVYCVVRYNIIYYCYTFLRHIRVVYYCYYCARHRTRTSVKHTILKRSAMEMLIHMVPMYILSTVGQLSSSFQLAYSLLILAHFLSLFLWISISFTH